MGRKARRNRSNSHSGPGGGLSDEEGGQADRQHGEEAPSKAKLKDVDFPQRREMQRQQAAEKRRSKMKCYLCGKAGHTRRECAGLDDGGRGMSRFKGKSNPKHEKLKYMARRQSRGSSGSYDTGPDDVLDSLEHLEEFARERGLMYFDLHCDVPATIEYLRTGRGKTKISQKEAIEEYQAAIKSAMEKTNMCAIISRTFLTKPGRPWINPVDSDIDGVALFFSIGLSASWNPENGTTEETVVESLLSSIQSNKNIIAAYATLDMTPETLEIPGQDSSSQIFRMRCCWEAAGRAQIPLQVHVLPGAASLDTGAESVAGTPYAQALLELQKQFVEATTKHPNIKIHIVGWYGRAAHMMALLKAFPQNIAAVGLDGAVTFSKATHLHECAFEIPLDRLVLETFNIIPSNVANAMGRTAFPGSSWWPFLAEAIVSHKKIVAMDELLTSISNTSQRLYPQLALQEAHNTGIPFKGVLGDATNVDENLDSSVRRAFVYGTLRNTGSNRHVVSDYIDECIDGCFIYGNMYYFGEGGRFPYVNEGGTQKVLGEVLTMTDWESALDHMDQLEGYPSFYYRKIQPVFKLSNPDAKPINAWVYFMQPSQESRGDPIQSGDWIRETRRAGKDA